jgi:hypothetical protein
MREPHDILRCLDLGPRELFLLDLGGDRSLREQAAEVVDDRPRDALNLVLR